MNSKIYLGFDNLSAHSIEDDAELIPLLSPEDEEEMEEPVFIAGIEALSPTRRFSK